MNPTCRTLFWILAALLMLAGLFALMLGHCEPGIVVLVLGGLGLGGLSRAEESNPCRWTEKPPSRHAKGPKIAQNGR
jgi:hypothetical protein